MRDLPVSPRARYYLRREPQTRLVVGHTRDLPRWFAEAGVEHDAGPAPHRGLVEAPAWAWVLFDMVEAFSLELYRAAAAERFAVQASDALRLGQFDFAQWSTDSSQTAELQRQHQARMRATFVPAARWVAADPERVQALWTVLRVSGSWLDGLEFLAEHVPELRRKATP